MVFINVRELSKLIETAENRGGLEQKVAEFQEKHNIKILLEEYETLVDLAIKINKREKGKAHDNSKKSSTAEVFTYGELKLFSWTLFLYCFTRTLSLTQLGEDDFQFFSKIFKQKTQAFIEYEINCLIWSKDKYVREWDEQELQLFHHITRSFFLHSATRLLRNGRPSLLSYSANLGADSSVLSNSVANAGSITAILALSVETGPFRRTLNCSLWWPSWGVAGLSFLVN